MQSEKTDIPRFKVDAPQANWQAYAEMVSSCADASTLTELLTDPMHVIDRIGLELPEHVRPAFAGYMKSTAACIDTFLNGPPKSEMIEGAGPEIEGIWMKIEDVRIILEIDHEVAKQVVNGVNIAAGVGAVFAAGATTIAAMLGFANAGLGLIAGVVAGVAGIYSGWLWAFSGIVAEVDKGNGIYLTVSIPQLVIAAAMIISAYFGAWWNLALAPLVCTPIPGTR